MTAFPVKALAQVMQGAYTVRPFPAWDLANLALWTALGAASSPGASAGTRSGSPRRPAHPAARLSPAIASSRPPGPPLGPWSGFP